MSILSLAMPTPLKRTFDYMLPANWKESYDENKLPDLKPGMRILAPFGSRKLVGILVEIKDHSDLPAAQLKSIVKVLDQQPTVTTPMLALCQWASSYYQHPIGDVFSNAIPVLLRKGKPRINLNQTRWRLSTKGKGLGEGALKRAKKQAELLHLLQLQPSIDAENLAQAGISKAVLKSLIDKDLVEDFESENQGVASTVTENPEAAATIKNNEQATEAAFTFNNEQQRAFDSIAIEQRFQCYLLEGVTGSGKTEIYLQLIAKCLENNKQTLVLIPEIGLTPQTVERFRRRFNCSIAILHSGLTDRERLLSWQSADAGEAGIILGTRSAVFTPMKNPGLVIVDEEHDGSFKQQDGFRYNARDIAIKRALQEQCPIILGSATPCLESLNNALQGRYQHLQLTHRAANAKAPTFQLLDIRHAPMEDGFSPQLVAAISAEVRKQNQVLVFINRRGFSPALMCHDCGFVAQCQHCDARMTVHFQQRLLRCHHCEGQITLPHYCPDCNSSQLDFKGTGSERSEQALKKLFPSTQVIRIDRDTTSRKNSMQKLIEGVYSGQPCILVGTQMLAKGHHFPDVTLVAVIDADGGLFSTDFRGPEKMGQLLVQVAGRAGRAAKPGNVIIQTHQPDHPLINSLVNNSYHHYARELLAERKLNGLPPFGYLALIRAETNNPDQAETFLHSLRTSIEKDSPDSDTKLYGPLPAPMARRAGYFRAQLLIHASQRKDLHRSLLQLCNYADQHKLAKKMRWSVDVDPIDML